MPPHGLSSFNSFTHYSLHWLGSYVAFSRYGFHFVSKFPAASPFPPHLCLLAGSVPPPVCGSCQTVFCAPSAQVCGQGLMLCCPLMRLWITKPTNSFVRQVGANLPVRMNPHGSISP